MPIPFILGALAIAALTAVVIALLGWENIINWFQNYFSNKGKIKSPDELAFTVKQSLENGKCKVIQGIFSKKSSKIEDGVEYTAEKLDEQLQEVHANDELVVYE